MDHNEFAQILDDEAKLWLPSDMFLTGVVPSEYGTNNTHNMDDLANHLATLSLLQNRPSRNLYRPPAPKTTPCLQCTRPVVHDVSENHLLHGYHDLGFDGGVDVGRRLLNGNGNGPGHLSARFYPVYNFQVKQQVDDFLETRARALQKQQNRPQNRVYPFLGNGLRPVSGFMKESGGTGVFHPRTVNPTTATSTNILKKKQAAAGPRNRQESQLTQQRNAWKSIGVSEQEDYYYHLTPEIALPHDWAY